MIKMIPPEWVQLLVILGFVVFGALAHAFNALKTHRDEGMEFTHQDFFILAFLATFSGMFFGLLTYTFLTQNIYIVTLFSGLGSFTGIVGLNRVTAIALDFFSSVLKNLTIKK